MSLFKNIKEVQVNVTNDVNCDYELALFNLIAGPTFEYELVRTYNHYIELNENNGSAVIVSDFRRCCTFEKINFSI